MPKMHELITDDRALGQLAKIRELCTQAVTPQTTTFIDLFGELPKKVINLLDEDLPDTKTYRITLDVVLPYDDDTDPHDLADQLCTHQTTVSDITTHSAEEL